MNVVAPRRGDQARAPAPAGARRPDAGEPASADLRSVHRAAAELRRGTPVLLDAAPGARLVVLSAETLGAASLAEFASVARGGFLLLLEGGRTRHWAPGSASGPAAIDAFAVSGAMLRPEALRGMADPTAAQWFAAPPPAEPPPPGAEAVLALAKLARLLPAALVAEANLVMPQTDLLVVTAADVLAQRMAGIAGMVRASEARVPLADAPDSRVVAFRSPDAGAEHLAVLVGQPERVAPDAAAPLVRIHSECFTGDLLGSLRCDCGPQLRGALRRMADEGAGVLLYLPQEGRGIGLVNKLRAYALQDSGLDTLDANRALGWGADERDFAAAAVMLRALGIARVRLLTNNPQKVAALEAGGIAVERVSHLFAANGINDAYLATKADRFGHLGD